MSREVWVVEGMRDEDGDWEPLTAFRTESLAEETRRGHIMFPSPAHCSARVVRYVPENSR